VSALREYGVVTAVARFSNVYGSTADHPDRVVPAFARAAANGGRIHVEGSANVFDFTCVSDVARGVLSMVEHVSDGQLLPPIHFTTGRGFTLGELAHLAKRQCTKDLEVNPATPRSYDVARFFGSTARAQEVLGWSHLVPIEEGFASMVNAFQGRAVID
jgi:nucleoside-diphosphate-sugar epimerase